MSNGSGKGLGPAASKADACVGTGKVGGTSVSCPPGHLIVRVRNPLDAGIKDVTVEVAGRGKKKTGADGVADFGNVPPGSYSITASKPDYGPLPSGAAVFAIGNTTATQDVPSGKTVTAEMRMVTVTSVKVSHTPVVAATPLRIYKGAIGDVHTDHIVTCTVLCPKKAGSGAGTQFPVRVDWTFAADAGNAPKAKGGKDNTDVHFGPVTGFPMSGGGTTTGSTISNDSGHTEITLRASVTSGDHFTVYAKVLRNPADTTKGDLGHDHSPKFEVWKRLDYNNLYRMVTGAQKGFDLASRTTVPNIQPAFTPAFTEYTVGPPHVVPYQEYITNLVAPTAAQLPLNGTLQVVSDGADTRVVTIHGLVVAADGSTSNGSEALTLNGTTSVVGAKKFQKVTTINVPVSPSRSIAASTSAGAAVAAIAPHHGVATPNFLFDTPAAVQAKAQAWYDANGTQIGIDLAALNTSIGAAGYFMVGAAYYHPKKDGRPATGRTTYYSGYPALSITYYGTSFHPDANWEGVDGVNQGMMSCLFLNVGGGSYASMVARHEIGHASDHVTYGAGDHCPQSTCLMYFSSTKNTFCTINPDHSVRRTEGWSP